MRLMRLRRRVLWLSAALLLAVVVGVGLFVPRSRITRENCERIRKGMSEEDVRAILGDSYRRIPGPGVYYAVQCEWYNGPNCIVVVFEGGATTYKSCYFPT